MATALPPRHLEAIRADLLGELALRQVTLSAIPTKICANATCLLTSHLTSDHTDGSMASQAPARRMTTTRDVERLRFAWMARAHVQRIGERIRQRRDELGLTQRELARAMPGATDSQRVSTWERGIHKPHPDHLEALAKVLDVDVAYFYGDTPAPGTADLMGALVQQEKGDQLDRLEKKVDALLSGLNEARALQARTHEILAANDRMFRERIAKVGAQVNELQEHVDGRLEELRLEAVEDVAAGFAEAPQRTGRAGPSPARTTGGPGEAPPRPAPAGGSRG